MSIKFTLPRERKWILGVSLMTSNVILTNFFQKCQILDFLRHFHSIVVVFDRRTRMPFSAADQSEVMLRSRPPATQPRRFGATCRLLIRRQIEAGALMHCKQNQIG